MRVLIAEDDPRLGALLVEVVGEHGWEPTLCTTGTDALAAARAGGVDVLLLDWGLPGLSGPEVVGALRAEGHRTPVLLLTARGAVPDRVHGLGVGADDYLVKPFDVEELLARVGALHRRASPGATTAFRAGDLVVDTVSRRVQRGGQEVALSAREFDILVVLADRAGRNVSRYTILGEVWDGHTDIRSNVIDVHVAGLRAKVDRPFGRNAVQTVRGAGYRLDPAGG